MSSVYDLIGGAFAFMDAPFGVHPKDRERALAYRDAAVAANMKWAEVERDIRSYCASFPKVEADKQVERARRLFAGHFE